MSDFTTELQETATRANMTVSDLAVWFERPRSTVNTWMHDGRAPLGRYAAEVRERLALIKRTLRHKQGLPIPADLHIGRPLYVRRTRDAAVRDGRVSPKRAAA